MFFPKRPQIRIGRHNIICVDSRKFLHVGHEDPGRLTEHHSIFHFGRDEDHCSVRLSLQVIEYVRKNWVDLPLFFLANN